MQKLPLGRQDFRTLREDNLLYVDKTKALYRLTEAGKFLFLARPRRFGKSLSLSTLKELFVGSKNLFEGLWIYDRWDWSKTYPVVHLDYSLVTYHLDATVFAQTLSLLLQRHAEQYQVTLMQQDPTAQLLELIEKLYQKTGNRVVLLIDEYDKPLIDLLHKPEPAERNREYLRNFYGVLKPLDSLLHFVLLTGVSKLAKVSIFSGLNNLQDVSLLPEFNTLVGFTQTELNDVFESYLAKVAAEWKLSTEEILPDVKRMYNGYAWGGTERVYNPVSVLSFLQEGVFKNFWFSTATPYFLLEVIRLQQKEISDFANAELADIEMDSFILENINIVALLFQTGYLTIKDIHKTRSGVIYRLMFPNQEVQHAFLTYLAGAFLSKEENIQPEAARLQHSLQTEDMSLFMAILRSLFARIPARLHMAAESYYHSLFYMILVLMGVRIELERWTDKGMIDGILELNDKIYIIEFKYADAGNMDALTGKAITQIDRKKYFETYLGSGKKIGLLGVGFLQKKIDYQLKWYMA